MSDNLVLLVDDGADDRALIVRMIKASGIPVRTATCRDGVEALDFLFSTGEHAGRDSADQPIVIILDLKMPRLGGFDVLKRLRQDARTKITPVVVLTSSSQEEDIVKSYSHGANSYVRKHVNFTRFSEDIKQLSAYWLLQNQFPKCHAIQ